MDPSQMTDLQKYTAILVFVMPILIAFLEKQAWTEDVRKLVAFGACVVAGLIEQLIILGPATMLANPVTVILTVGILAIGTFGAYQAIWKPSGVAPKIEATFFP